MSNEEKSEVKESKFTVSALLLMVLGRVFQRQALLAIGAIASLLGVGGGSVIWAQSEGASAIKTIVASAVKDEARERQALERRVDERLRLSERQADRMEAKLDRVDARMQQVVEVAYSLKGQKPPPAPELREVIEAAPPVGWMKWKEQAP